jgi:hypothetical protein
MGGCAVRRWLACFLNKAARQTVHGCQTPLSTSSLFSWPSSLSRRSARGQGRSNDLSQPTEARGLTKIEAEDLLDRLEAAGFQLCQLSYADGQGFRVRATLPT